MAREMNVISYNENWSIVYQEEKSILQSIFCESIMDIQHFGSTSIHGMTAKPTIDIMIIVKSIDEVDKFNEEMIKHDYIVRGENGIPRRRYFVRLKEDGENHASHVHVYELENPHVQDELMFRDFVRVNKEAFLQYETMKKVVSDLYRFSPHQYEEAKNDCVMYIMQKARDYFFKWGAIQSMRNSSCSNEQLPLYSFRISGYRNSDSLYIKVRSKRFSGQSNVL